MTVSPTSTTRRLIAGLAGIGLFVAACGSDNASADPATTTGTTTAGKSTTTTRATTTTETSTTTNAPATTVESTTTTDEGQDIPFINDWRLDVESLPCEESDLPGSHGGEAVLPATWAAGNADYVDFFVDGDLRPANSVRDIAGPGNIEVPCDPALNDGHQVVIVAYTGSPGDPGPDTAGQTLIVTTTATTDD